MMTLKHVLIILVLALLIIQETGTADEPEPAVHIKHIGLITSDTIGITIQAGRIEYGKHIPYQKQAQDSIDVKPLQVRVSRDSAFLGWLVGHKQDRLYTVDRLIGEALDTEMLDAPASYRIISSQDPHYKKPLQPEAVYRKSKPTDFGRWEHWIYKAPLQHTVYLKLSKPLQQDKQYRILINEGSFPVQTFTYQPDTLRSEAIHVSHLGFRPDDPAKVGFLSCWLGNGGPAEYDADIPFSIIDASGSSVFTGKTVLSKSRNERNEDAYKKNYSGTDVFIMDFSALSQPGTYRIMIDGIGCSYPFTISESVWQDAFYTAARGFYHMRSGIELGPPYTNFKRPETFMPGKQVTVYHSDCPLMDSGNGLNAKGTDKNNFGNLVKGKTDTVVADAWGGYMDAGDWDRRIQHLLASRYLIELAELFPDTYRTFNLTIPESENALPDIIDEALFNLDCYRRMQTPAGGIRGGIESEEHPRHGERSWEESLTVMAYAPGIWSSYIYAGVAAQAAFNLQSIDSELSDIYTRSALKAMEWAEDNYDADAEYPHQVRDTRNLAAAELFRLTGSHTWHNVFLATTVFSKEGQDLFLWKKQEQRDAPWVYVRTEHPLVNNDIQANCRQAIIREAENRLTNCYKTGFRWIKYEWQPPIWGAFTVSDGISLGRAHFLTGKRDYLKALVLGCQAGAGANPLNLCYTTGLGHESPRNALHLDSRLSGQPVPPGLTVAGPIDVERHKDYWAQKIVNRYCFPDVQQWPTLEAYWDVFWYPPMCEYTIHNPMARNVYAWGYLAGRKAIQDKETKNE